MKTFKIYIYSSAVNISTTKVMQRNCRIVEKRTTNMRITSPQRQLYPDSIKSRTYMTVLAGTAAAAGHNTTHTHTRRERVDINI